MTVSFLKFLMYNCNQTMTLYGTRVKLLANCQHKIQASDLEFKVAFLIKKISAQSLSQ